MKINKKGVSLPELLAVIVIMGLIAAISIPAFSSMIKNSKKDKTISEAKVLYDKISTTMTSYDVSSNADVTMEMFGDIISDYNGDVPFYEDAINNLFFLDSILFLSDGSLDLRLGLVSMLDYDVDLDFNNPDCKLGQGMNFSLNKNNIDDFSRECVK